MPPPTTPPTTGPTTRPRRPTTSRPVDRKGGLPPPLTRPGTGVPCPPGAAENKPFRTRIVAYARVSTDKQAEEGISLEAQAARFRAYAVAHDVELVAIESDSLSGKNMKRPALERALAMLEAGQADGLLVAKLDRLSRNLRDGEDLVERYFSGKARFVLLSVADSIDTRSAGGRLMFRVLMAFAQHEREVIGERTKDALVHARATGGGTPRLEGAGVARIAELAAAGLSLRLIAARLTEEGIPTLKGGQWAKETVRKVLERTRGAA